MVLIRNPLSPTFDSMSRTPDHVAQVLERTNNKTSEENMPHKFAITSENS